MAKIDLPDWFITKYSKHPDESEGAQQSPVSEAPKEPTWGRLYSAYQNLEVADTQQERERITGSLLASTRKQVDPNILSSLAEKYAKQDTNIMLNLEPHENLFNTQPAISMRQAAPKVKQVFTDQNQMEKIIASAPEEGRVVSFKDAFKKARAKGMTEFEYKGQLFNTQQSGESTVAWQEKMRSASQPAFTPFVPGFERERSYQEVPAAEPAPVAKPVPVTEPVTSNDKLETKQLLEDKASFVDYMKKAGITFAEGKQIDSNKISAKMGPAIEKVVPIFRKAGIIPEITSGARDLGIWSLHEVGEAIDLRLKTADQKAISTLEASLPGKPSNTIIHGERGRMWSDGTYEYIIHGAGDNIHLHIERETEDSKQRLVEHMIKTGRESKIPDKGLSKYPNLLMKYKSKLHKVN